MSKPGYKEKMSEAVRLAYTRPEVRAKMIEINQRIAKNPEYREKQRLLGLGRKHTPDTIAKMKAANTEELRNKTKKERMTPEVKRRLVAGIKKGWLSRKANQEKRRSLFRLSPPNKPVYVLQLSD